MRGKCFASLANLRIYVLLFAILVSIHVSAAQYDDADGDGIYDPFDACAQTSIDEGLPQITQNKEYLGCSCSQILSITGNNCYDIFCSAGRPFMIKPRTTAIRGMECGEDYCINETLYDFPAPRELACIKGAVESFSCNATLIKNSQLCINGTVPQYAPENSKETFQKSVLLSDYEKLQNRAYLISQSNEIITVLGISGMQPFLSQEEKTAESAFIDKTLDTESRTIINVQKTISIKKITITPDRHKILKDVYVFEELPKGANVNPEEVITGSELIYRDDKLPVLLVWKIDKITEPIELTYQVNKQISGDSNTLIIARQVKTDFWKIMLVPVALIIAAVIIFTQTYEKSVPKRKKIFKD